MLKPIVLTGILLGVSLAGCKRADSRVNQLTLGMPRDSAVALMGVEKPERVEPYLVSGQFIEALFFAKPGADSGTTPDRELTPVIVVNGTLAGWGWEKWDSIAAANKIVVAPKD